MPDALRGIVRFKEQRVFRCHFVCPACDSRFMDEMLVNGASYCPHCELRCEPAAVTEFTEEWPEFDVAEMEID